MTDQAMRSHIGEHPINFRQGEASVYWNRYDSKPATAVHQLYVLRAVRQKQALSVAAIPIKRFCSSEKDKRAALGASASRPNSIGTPGRGNGHKSLLAPRNFDCRGHGRSGA